MTYLLDVSTILARLWENHVFHRRVIEWMDTDSQPLAICPITELGFLRISVSTFGAEMKKARQMLSNFQNHYQPTFVPCDLAALEGMTAPSASKTIDFYLADLAASHSMQWE